MNKSEPGTAHPLKKILGVGFGIAVVIGGTIGAGILRNPGEIAALVPNYWLVLACWLIGGLYVLLAAGSYAELTTMMPKAGGAYNYIKRAFGNYAGFLSGWFDYFINGIAPAYFCIALSEYSLLLFPGLPVSRTMLAIGYLTFFAILHAPGIRIGSASQKITSALKVVLFIVLIVLCFTYGTEGKPSGQENGALSVIGMSGFVVAFFKALQLITGTYNGWMSVSFFAEEDKDPGKNIPRSYFIGALAVMSLYLLINAAILYIVPVEVAAKSPLVAADAAGAIFGRKGMVFLTLFAIFSLLSILNAYMMIPARILFGLSRDAYFLRIGSYINTGGTPIYALIISYLFAMVLIINSSFEQLFGLASFMLLVVTGLAYAAVIRLRKSEPDTPRPYRAWGYPYSTVLTILATAAMFIGFSFSDPWSLAVIAVMIAVSYPVYRLTVTRRRAS